MISTRRVCLALAGDDAAKRSSRLCYALLLLAVASPALIHAQFQEPTSEELQITEEPKAPGAAAIYLYHEDVTEEAEHFRSFYDRIKVLTEKGKELATVQIPYIQGIETVTDVQGRTIHADGTIIPLVAKPADLMDIKAKGYQLNTITFTLPSAEVGSILEYRLKIGLPGYRAAQPIWNVQQNHFTRKAHFSFRPSQFGGGYVTDSHGQMLDRIMCFWRAAPDAKVNYDKGRNLYSFDITDIPPAPDDEWMPPINTVRWRVEFYYTKERTSSEFWTNEGKLWAADANDFANPSRGLKKVIADIVAPTDTDEQKAQKIYTAVQKLDNTSFSREKSKVERKQEKLKDIHKAEDVWKQQSGDDDEIALLYVALARAADLKAWPMQVVSRNRAVFDEGYLSTRQFDDFIAIVVLDGKEVYLDPGQKMCPFGLLNWKHTLAPGFRLTEKGAVIAMTPAGSFKSAVVQRVADLTIDEQGNVTGTARFVMTGPDALRWRQLALENDPEEVKKQFNEWMRESLPDGVDADFDHFLGLDDSTVNLIGFVKISGNLATVTGKHFFLPGLFFESHAKHPFVSQDKRTIPIDLHYALMEQDDVTYHLPPGFAIENAPRIADLSWPTYAVLKINSAVSNGSVEVVRTFVRNFAMLDPKVYSDLHDFYLKVAATDQLQLVLTRVPAGKGN